MGTVTRLKKEKSVLSKEIKKSNKNIDDKDFETVSRPVPSSKPAIEQSTTVMKEANVKDRDVEVAYMKANLSSMITDEKQM